MILQRTAAGVIIVGGLWALNKLAIYFQAWQADREEDKRLENMGLDQEHGGYDIVAEVEDESLTVESETPYDPNENFWAFGGGDNWMLIPDAFDDFALGVNESRSLAANLTWRYPARTGNKALRMQPATWPVLATDADGNSIPQLRRPKPTAEEPLPDKVWEQDTVWYYCPSMADANPIGYGQYLIALEGPAGWATTRTTDYTNENAAGTLTNAEYIFSLYLKHVGVRIFTDKLEAYKWSWTRTAQLRRAVFPVSSNVPELTFKRPLHDECERTWNETFAGKFFPCWKDSMEPVPIWAESGAWQAIKEGNK